MLYAGTIIGWFGPALPILFHPNSTIKVTSEDIPIIAGIIQLSSVPGSILGSIQADRYGRKKTIMFQAIPFLASSLILACAENVYYIYVSRLIAGFAIGVCYSVNSIYISEVSSPQIRGILNIFSNMFINVGILIQYLIGPFNSIQMTALVTAIIPILMFIFIWGIPESPYFYAMNKKIDKVEQALVYLRGTYDVKEEVDRITSGARGETMEGNLLSLFTNPISRRVLFITTGLAMGQQFSGYFPISSYTLVILGKGESAPPVATIGIILALLNFPIAFVIALCVDIVGRRSLFMFSSLTSIIPLLSIAVFFYLQDFTHSSLVQHLWYVPTISFIGLRFTFSIGIECLPYICASELFPTSVKGMGICFMSIIGAIGGFVCFKVFQLLTDYVGIFMSFGLFAFCCLCSAIFVYFCLPETRSRPLEDIQKELRGEKVGNKDVTC